MKLRSKWDEYLTFATVLGVVGFGLLALAVNLRDRGISDPAPGVGVPVSATIPDPNTHIIPMPQNVHEGHFPAIIWTCAGHNGLYETSRTAGVNFIVVPNDSNCQG